jgi:hypothetical protein
MIQLDDIVKMSYSHLPNERAGAAIKLGQTHDKKAFSRLVQMTTDTEPYVIGDAILGLGTLQDSRAYFVLANLFVRAKEMFRDNSYGIKKRVLNAFGENQDPRAKEIALESLNDEALAEIAKDTLQKIDSKTTPFVYTYVGDEERRQTAEMNYHRFLLRDYQDLKKAIPLIEKEKNGHPSRPQTYIITTDNKMYIGGDVHEHVDVAQGEDVLAAGEAYFEKYNNKWIIEKINNRSYGYFPDKTCFSEIKKAMENSGITIPNYICSANPTQGWMDNDLLDWNWKEIQKIRLKK